MLFRSPKTNNERKQCFDDQVKEYVIKIRGKRSFRNLPTNWEDVYKDSCGQRSWKYYRKSKYKIKQESHSFPITSSKEDVRFAYEEEWLRHFM